MAAVLACGAGAVLSHRSAAQVHGLLRMTQTRVEVTIPRPVGRRHPGIRIHRSTRLVEADRAAIRGIPVTSLARTLLDVASVSGGRLLERACDQAAILGVLDMSDVRELLARSKGRRGVRRLRAVLGPGRVGENVPRSELERRFLGLCLRDGLPHPELNVWLPIEGEEMQVDFLWREQGVIVEVDGWATHGTRLAFQRDRRRDRQLALDGWRVVRFTWDDVTGDSVAVTTTLRHLLASSPLAS
jgi:hypothetical protein